jgi:hypothetical protein
MLHRADVPVIIMVLGQKSLLESKSEKSGAIWTRTVRADRQGAGE